MTTDRYAKRPPSQYRTPEFDFRGGDILKEQEYLREEHRKVLAECQAAQRHLDQLDFDVRDAAAVLRQREGYTQALSTFLERDSSAAQQELEMKDHLLKLESDIEGLQNQLAEIKALHNPAATNTLLKERAYYLIEIQRGREEIAQNREMSKERRDQIAACTVHPQYRKVLRADAEVGRLLQKKLRMRVIVSHAQISMQDLPVVCQAEDEISRRERDILRRNIEGRVNLLRMEERKRSRNAKKRLQLEFLLAEIEEINARMRDLGLAEYVYETGELRKRVLGDWHPEEEEKAEQLFATNTQLAAKKRKKWGLGDV
jgi:hypothetical protein